MKLNMYIQSYNINKGNKNTSKVKRLFTILAAQFRGVRFAKATALIYNKLNTDVRLKINKSVDRRMFLQTVFDKQKELPKVIFYTEGIFEITTYKGLNSNVGFSEAIFGFLYK